MENRFYSIAAVIVSLVALTFAVAAPFNQAEPDTVSVSGTAEVTSPPNMVDVVLAVETQSEDVARAQALNRNRSADVMAALQALNISKDQISTSDYRVERVQQRDESGRPTTITYRVVNQIAVELHATSRAGEVIDAAIKAGANRVDSVSFGLTEAREQELQDRALREAADVAANKASALAERLNVKLGDPVSIAESSFNIYRFEADYAKGGAGGDAAAPTEIAPGEVRVTASVSVDYRIK